MNTPHVGYVIRMFPQLSETFIANEILNLERLGVPINIYSYRQPHAPVEHECVRAIASPVTYLPDPLYRHAGDIARGVVPPTGDYWSRYIETLGYVFAYTVRQRNPDTWRRLLQAAYLTRLLHGSGIKRLHAHMAHGSTRVAMLTSMLTGLPFSFTAHARDIYKANPERLHEKIDAAEFVVTCTRANQDYLRDIAPEGQQEKILLGYHGVDAAKFSPPAAKFSPSTRAENETPTILAVGRLVEKKGFPDLIDAVAVLKERGISFRCRVAGDGPDLKALRRKIHELNVGDAITLLGPRTQEQLVEEYRGADAFALPSVVQQDGDRDGIPNVLLEAMATGLPVVSTPVSGIPELVRTGDNGLLVEPGNPRELASAIELLLNDGGLRERLGRQGRATVSEQFNSTTTARWLARLFEHGPAAAQDAHSEVSLVGGS